MSAKNLVLLMLLSMCSVAMAKKTANPQNNTICPKQLSYMQQATPLVNATLFDGEPFELNALNPQLKGDKMLWDVSAKDINLYMACSYKDSKNKVIIHLPDVKQCESNERTYPHISCQKVITAN